MKKFAMLLIAASAVLGGASAAWADNGCKEEIAKAEKAWQGHLHENVGSGARAWKSVGEALDFARKSCNEGKTAEAYETVNLVNRWVGEKEHTKH